MQEESFARAGGRRYLGADVTASLRRLVSRSSAGHVLVVRARAPVVSQGPCEREVPPAACARVRLLPRVNPGVPAQLSGSHEGLVALRAAVGLLPRVRPHVRGQSPLLRERLPAVGAVVGRDARVEPLVPHQRPRQGKALVAVGALVRPLARVGPLVVPQLRRGVAALVAAGARELLPRESGDRRRMPRLQVGFQVPVPGEAFQADGAAIRPLARVGPPVQPELALAGKPLFAESAGKRLLPRVDPLVDHEQTLLRESLFAGGAGEGPLSGVGPQVTLELGGVGEVFAAHRAAVGGRRLFVLAVKRLGGGLCWPGASGCSSSSTERREKTRKPSTTSTSDSADRLVSLFCVSDTAGAAILP